MATPRNPQPTPDIATPLWQQVLEDLERRLASGEINDRFPTDRELVDHYDVSRHTVREAVRHLKARGVIERERGRGSVVARPQFLQPLGTVYSLFQAVEATGASQTSEVLALERTADVAAAEKLGLEPDDELVRLERLRRIDDEPLALDTVWLPAEVGAPLLDVDFSRTALYTELDRLTGFAPTSGEEVITPVLPDDELRRVLELDDDEGVLRIERTSEHDDRAIECRITLIRGSRFALVSRWPSPGTTSVEVRGT